MSHNPDIDEVDELHRHIRKSAETCSWDCEPIISKENLRTVNIAELREADSASHPAVPLLVIACMSCHEVPSSTTLRLATVPPLPQCQVRGLRQACCECLCGKCKTCNVSELDMLWSHDTCWASYCFQSQLKDRFLPREGARAFSRCTRRDVCHQAAGRSSALSQRGSEICGQSALDSRLIESGTCL